MSVVNLHLRGYTPMITHLMHMILWTTFFCVALVCFGMELAGSPAHALNMAFDAAVAGCAFVSLVRGYIIR